MPKTKELARALVRAYNSAVDYGDHEPVLHREVKNRLRALQLHVNEKQGRKTVDDEEQSNVGNV